MQFSKETMKGSVEVIVLKALADEKAYGYELVERITRISGNIFELQEGTLYPLLYRLEDHGDVKSSVMTTPGGKQRRYYTITNQGKKLLKAKTSEYVTFIYGLQKALNLSRYANV
ncbi:TPA: PadR family transcriptional regulator [Candidatus Uhrbacteria bacterium]|nr:PadR family transcriptional regulator [Candidatus Uhrbacteria bacterium]